MNKLILVDFDKREVRFVSPEELIPKVETHSDDHSWVQCCRSHRHIHHTWIPWAYKKPYDKVCDICNTPAAWVSGNNIPLCDCHAEDWTLWTDKDDRIHISNVKNIWLDSYRDFKKAVLDGEFIPNTIKG